MQFKIRKCKMVLQMAKKYEEDIRIHYLLSQSNVIHKELSE